MPRFPAFAERTESVSGSVFEKLKARMSARDDLVALHIGDAHAAPPYDLPLDRDFVARHTGFNRYCDTFGIPELRDAIAEKVHDDNELDAHADNVLVTCGATHALSVTTQSLVDPGDEVILLSPYWPFFRGMVSLAGGTPVEVPFYTTLYENPACDVAALIEAAVTGRTVAIYLNSPNNPSGKVLTRAQLEAVCGVARKHGLWLISDEAYDGMTFDGRTHHSPGSFPGMFDRTVSIFTFSKVFMFSGARLGYVAGSRELVETLNKSVVHQLYSVSTVVQQMMVSPLRSRRQWQRDYVERVEAVRDRTCDRLSIPAGRPDGAYYLFFPVMPYLHGRTATELIEQCIDAGVSIAPGADFGVGFEQYARICFAGQPPDRLDVAIDRLNRILV